MKYKIQFLLAVLFWAGLGFLGGRASVHVPSFEEANAARVFAHEAEIQEMLKLNVECQSRYMKLAKNCH